MDRRRILGDNHPLPSIHDAFKCDDTCLTCGGEGVVCENHPDKAWPTECSCGAGEPCPHAVR